MKTALVVIDVQNYFISKHTKKLPSKIAEYIINNHLDFVLFTQFINNNNTNYVKLLKWDKCMKSPEIDIHEALVPFVTEVNLFVKHTYSIFKSEQFVAFLEQNSITSIQFCGTDSDACVLASAYEGFDLGYNVSILTELSGSHLGDNYEEAAQTIIEKNINEPFDPSREKKNQ